MHRRCAWMLSRPSTALQQERTLLGSAAARLSGGLFS